MATFYTQRLTKDEIRLLTLQPGKFEDSIRCSLHTARLDELPAFDALSYTWGDPEQRKDITVQGSTHSVTANLMMALRAIRRRRKPYTVWIDALCINQADVPEKNVQVPLMGEIYGKAEHVVIWLGPSTPETALYATWAQTYVTKSYGWSSLRWLLLDAAAPVSYRARRERDVRRLRAHQGYFQLNNSPYWSRMWTFQEYQLAKEEPICVCGDMVVTRTAELEAIFDTMGDLAMSVVSRLTKLLEASHTAAQKEQVDRDEKLVLRELGKSDALSTGRGSRTLPKFILGEIEGKEITMLLKEAAGRQCFNRLDKVYGLYGMAEGLRTAYPPDYEKKPELVLRETTAYIINHERVVDIYTLFAVRDGALDDEAPLPSWVPDFDQASSLKPRNLHPPSRFLSPNQDQEENVGIQHEGTFDGDREKPPLASVEATLTVLSMSARELGTCRVALRFADEPVGVLRQLLNLLGADGGGVDGEAKIPGAGSPAGLADSATPLAERIVRACTAHESTSIQFTVPDLIAACGRVFATLERGEKLMLPRVPKGGLDELGTLIEFTCQRAAQGLTGKTLFTTTERGLFGIGVPAINDGDVLILVPGIKFPVLLRPRERVATAGGPHAQYRLVGTSYVDGVMSPLSVSPELMAEVKQLELKVFDIW